MDNPSYRQRSKGELRGALRWAQGILHMRDWTIHLAIDEHSPFEEVRHKLFSEPECVAAMSAGPEFLVAWIGIYRDRAPAAKFDTLFTMFHEMAHIVTWDSRDFEKEDEGERAATRIAWLLWKLWHKR